uniref:Growth regulating estrogen receptor binding 1 n=1 Tax=Scophthalmus maximus TaxID=52904 RepID=A0A8D3CFA5_SCOMX
MGNSYAGQLRTTRFEEVLHNSIEASLRSNTVIPRPVFSQLYLETEQSLAHDGRTENDDEDDEDGSETNSPPIPYQMKPPPDGCCTTDGFCQAGRDLRLSSMTSDSLDVPPGFLLVGIKSPSLPETLLVCAVDRRFLPDERGRHALLGFSGNCTGCGEKGFRYFTEFSNHINLKLSTQPKKQKHLKYHLYRNNQGALVKGAPICWRGHGKSIVSIAFTPTGKFVHVINVLDVTLHTVGSHVDPAGLPQVTDLPQTLTNGHHAVPSVTQPPLNQSGPGRPSVTGTHANAGPPKKRHKGWSPDSVCVCVCVCVCVFSSQHSSTPLPLPELPVTVPDQLLHTCRLQPVVFKGHGSLPQLTGNVSEVLVSSLLQSCYLSSQVLPRVYQHYGPSPIQPLSTEMQILLTVYYLVQLGPDQVPLIEDLEQIFMRSWRESHLSEIRQYQQPQTPTPSTLPGLPQSQQPLTPSQLPWLAQLAASSCGEGVVVLGEQIRSLAQGLEQTFSRLMEGRLKNTNYVVIIVTAAGKETQSCVVVTGKHQCRALAETMYSPCEGLKEINHQLSTGVAQELIHFCNSLGQGDNDISHLTKAAGDCPKYSVEWREVRSIQLAVARKLLSHVCAIADSSTQNLDLGSFDRVSFLILVPPSEVTFQQTVLHVRSSGVLQELGTLDQECASQREAEHYVVKMDQSAQAQIDNLIQEAQSNTYTLYILVHDHAHWDISSGSGLVDQLLNSRRVRDAPNILILHVTSFPFALQTQYTRISPYNEIHWPSAFSNDVDLYHEKTRYFGVSELLESTRSGSSLPLMRHDSSFESMASALEERFPKLHSAVIRTTVLIQHYCVALMAASGRISGSHNLHKHTSVETLEIVQSLLTAAQQCPARHGHMVLLRIPSLALAAWAHRRLSKVRRQLGLEESFEIILGNPNQPLNIGQTFTDQIKTWQQIQDSEWIPRTYLELEALPCILILSGAEPLGESLPRSLKYCDLRVISCSYLQRTTLEQELGLAAYLVKEESRPPHDPGPGSDLLESDAEKLSSTDNEEEEEGQENEDSPLSSTQPLPPTQSRRQHSKSTSSGSLSPRSSSPHLSCSWARGVSRPPSVLLPRALCDIIMASDSSGLPRCTSFLPHMSVAWASSFRPLLSKMMTCTEQSLYYRQWTAPRSHHMDSSNRTEGRSDNFHPRRLLLSGPPQVGKTGAYLHFLGILSRMLIRLMEVDIYDEEDVNYSAQADGVQYHPPNASWPNPDIMKTMPFDYTLHDPKYDDISAVYCPGYRPSVEGNPVRQEDVYLRRRTSRIKLSKYAAYNTYHHCEQCHQYLGFNPRYQMYESTLHAFTFTHLLLGEEIQLYFIIPKSKEHYFSFSQPGGQLESMRLPLISDWSPDCIKSPIFTPTTGRHEHGLFNLYHAMDGASHLHILVVKEYEMAVYKKYWPNHIMLVLPTVFNGTGIGAAHFLIKELSYHNLELERSRRLEGGGPAVDVWPFIILADDSCVMFNTVDLDARNGPTEHAVSLKQVLQHMEACPDLANYGLCGIRKWSSRGLTGQGEPFSRGHLHDFLLLNVDRSQNIQYDQNRFTCHDVDFTLRLHSAGLLVCRFNSFSVMKKQIAIGGYKTFIIKTKMTDVPTSVGPSQYICAPDSKHLFLATPAQLLLEKYLQHTSQKLFPLSTKNYAHPVLSVDCYLNLGPEVTVCFVSSRPHSVNISTTGLLFSGLLLCFADTFVTAGFLKKFTFLKGATLCVISADRSSLRQTVGRLELEEEWRFRLSDEFQTANAKEDRPLFFLTGKHI